MKNRILKTAFAFALSATLVIGTAVPVFAADEVTEPVHAETGQNITVGNVSVESSSEAVSVTTRDNEGEQKDASVKVNGNVTLENYEGGTAVYAESMYGNAAANIDGGVTSKTSYNTAYGIMAVNNSENDNISTNVTVGDDVFSKSSQNAIGVGSYNADISVSGNVKSEGANGTGIEAQTKRQSDVKVNGSVDAVGSSTATGAYLSAHKIDESTGNLTLKVNNITANANGAGDNYCHAVGISVCNCGGTITADINGDVQAIAQTGSADGIELLNGFYGDEVSSGSNTINIHGNLISDGIGILNNLYGAPVTTDILVENEIKSSTVGILTDRIPDASTTPIQLTVWKITPNANNNVAEYVYNPVYYQDGMVPEGVETSGADKDFEKTINYIIKVEQPSAGGTISTLKGNGSVLDKYHDFDTAREGDKVILKVDLEQGYSIKAAYNGIGEKVQLLQDENGDYYVIVPKGGGIYLSVELEEQESHDVIPTPADPEKSKADNGTEAKGKTGQTGKKGEYKQVAEPKAILTYANGTTKLVPVSALIIPIEELKDQMKNDPEAIEQINNFVQEQNERTDADVLMTAAVNPLVFGDAVKADVPLTLNGVSTGETVTFPFETGAEDTAAAAQNDFVNVTFHQAGAFAAALER